MFQFQLYEDSFPKLKLTSRREDRRTKGPPPSPCDPNNTELQSRVRVQHMRESSEFPRSDFSMTSPSRATEDLSISCHAATDAGHVWTAICSQLMPRALASAGNSLKAAVLKLKMTMRSHRFSSVWNMGTTRARSFPYEEFVHHSTQSFGEHL
ncbi:hypothetical protein SEVIR_9G054450v4 [Setaria viridis]